MAAAATAAATTAAVATGASCFHLLLRFIFTDCLSLFKAIVKQITVLFSKNSSVFCKKISSRMLGYGCQKI
jgi:hypothetical protein